MLPAPLNFAEATAYVVRRKAVAFCFMPERDRGGQVVGGTLWVLAYNTDCEIEVEAGEYGLFQHSGSFAAKYGCTELYSCDEIPEEAKVLGYRPATCDLDDVLSERLEDALRLLEKSAIF